MICSTLHANLAHPESKKRRMQLVERISYIHKSVACTPRPLETKDATSLLALSCRIRLILHSKFMKRGMQLIRYPGWYRLTHLHKQKPRNEGCNSLRSLASGKNKTCTSGNLETKDATQESRKDISTLSCLYTSNRRNEGCNFPHDDGYHLAHHLHTPKPIIVPYPVPEHSNRALFVIRNCLTQETILSKI